MMWRGACLAAGLAALAQGAAAQGDVVLGEVGGDPEYGAYLASECTSCHRADGAVEGIPAIVHWYEPDFVDAMNAYKSGGRAHPVMNMIAARLGDEEIAALAAYFATLP